MSLATEVFLSIILRCRISFRVSNLRKLHLGRGCIIQISTPGESSPNSVGFSWLGRYWFSPISWKIMPRSFLLRSLCSHTDDHVRLHSKLSDSFGTSSHIRKRCSISALLLGFFINQIMEDSSEVFQDKVSDWQMVKSYVTEIMQTTLCVCSNLRDVRYVL